MEITPLVLTHPFHVSPVSVKTIRRFKLATDPVPVLTARYADNRVWYQILNRERMPVWVPAACLRYEGLPVAESATLLPQEEVFEGEPTKLPDGAETPAATGTPRIRGRGN